MKSPPVQYREGPRGRAHARQAGRIDAPRRARTRVEPAQPAAAAAVRAGAGPRPRPRDEPRGCRRPRRRAGRRQTSSSPPRAATRRWPGRRAPAAARWSRRSRPARSTWARPDSALRSTSRRSRRRRRRACWTTPSCARSSPREGRAAVAEQRFAAVAERVEQEYARLDSRRRGAPPPGARRPAGDLGRPAHAHAATRTTAPPTPRRWSTTASSRASARSPSPTTTRSPAPWRRPPLGKADHGHRRRGGEDLPGRGDRALPARADRAAA